MEIQVLDMKYALYNRQTGRDDVLPFYAYSFEQLNPNEDYVLGYGYHKSFQTVVKDGLKDVCRETIPDYYYDIKNWDDFSCAAPQYMLLDELGWNSTRPLSFKITDQIGLYLALEHFAICSPKGASAGVAVSAVNSVNEEHLIMLVRNTDNRREGKLHLSDFCLEAKDISDLAGGDICLKSWLKLNDQNAFQGEILMENSWFRAKIQYYRGKSHAV